MNIQLLDDRILVKPLTTLHQDSPIFIPATAEGRSASDPGNANDTFIGEVVATGPGDRLLHLECAQCKAERRVLADRADGRLRRRTAAFRPCSCGAQNWLHVGESRVPTQVKVGDKVVFPRRPNTAAGDWDGILIDGERYLEFNEEQSALAVLESA